MTLLASLTALVSDTAAVKAGVARMAAQQRSDAAKQETMIAMLEQVRAVGIHSVVQPIQESESAARPTGRRGPR